MKRKGEVIEDLDSYSLVHRLCRMPILKPLLRKFYAKRVFVWYWREERKYVNFGDYITEVLLDRLGYKTVNFDTVISLGILANYKFCLLIIGSELHRGMMDMLKVPEVYVWGQGKGHGISFDVMKEPYKDKVKIFAVRGPHTARELNLNGVPMGDPAFLLPVLFDVGKDHLQYMISYIPHWSNRENWKAKIDKIGAIRFVDVMCLRKDFWRKVQEIISSSFVLTNSFHTAAVCQAYGTPWTLCLADGDVLNYPDKWMDLFELLGLGNVEITRNYKEGFRWWNEVGYKAKLIDIRALMRSFPLPIREK